MDYRRSSILASGNQGSLYIGNFGGLVPSAIHVGPDSTDPNDHDLVTIRGNVTGNVTFYANHRPIYASGAINGTLIDRFPVFPKTVLSIGFAGAGTFFYGYGFAHKIRSTAETVAASTLGVGAYLMGGIGIGSLTGTLAPTTVDDLTNIQGVASFAYRHIDKLDYTTKTIYLLSETLATNITQSTGISFATQGYTFGGYKYDGIGTTSVFDKISTIKKFTFATETFATFSTVLASARARAASSSNTTIGHIAGGENASDTVINTIDKFTSAEVLTSAVTTLGTAVNHSATMNTSTFGYIANGYTGAVHTTAVQRIERATDTATTIAGTITARRETVSMSSTTKGYTHSGTNDSVGSNLSTTGTLTFSGEVTATLTKNLESDMYGGSSIDKTGASYWFGGGYAAHGFITAIVREFDHSTEVVRVLYTHLTQPQKRKTGCIGKE